MTDDISAVWVHGLSTNLQCLDSRDLHPRSLWETMNNAMSKSSDRLRRFREQQQAAAVAAAKLAATTLEPTTTMMTTTTIPTTMAPSTTSPPPLTLFPTTIIPLIPSTTPVNTTKEDEDEEDDEKKTTTPSVGTAEPDCDEKVKAAMRKYEREHAAKWTTPMPLMPLTTAAGGAVPFKIDVNVKQYVNTNDQTTTSPAAGPAAPEGEIIEPDGLAGAPGAALEEKESEVVEPPSTLGGGGGPSVLGGGDSSGSSGSSANDSGSLLG